MRRLPRGPARFASPMQSPVRSRGRVCWARPAPRSWCATCPSGPSDAVRALRPGLPRRRRGHGQLRAGLRRLRTPSGPLSLPGKGSAHRGRRHQEPGRRHDRPSRAGPADGRPGREARSAPTSSTPAATPTSSTCSSRAAWSLEAIVEDASRCSLSSTRQLDTRGHPHRARRTTSPGRRTTRSASFGWSGTALVAFR